MKHAAAIASLILALLFVASAVTATAQDYAGAYGGLGFSYGSGETEAIRVGAGPSSGNDPHAISGFSFGGFLGRNWQSGRSILGVEAGLEVSDINGDDNFNDGVENGTRVLSFGHVSGRVGRVNDLGMLYASLGVALADVRLTERAAVGGPITGTNDVSHVGARLGLGAEFPLRTGRVRLEVSHSRFDRESGSYPGYVISSEPHVNQAGVYYVFGF